jgi:putative addiction module antidote
MGRKIFRSGNSTVVSIRPDVLELLDLEPGDQVTVTADPEQHRIVLTPTEAGSSREEPEIPDRLSQLIERYGPALERLAEMEERGQDEAERGLGSDALERARGLRQTFAARYGILGIDLVDAVRTEREAAGDLALELREEDEGYESGR